MATRSIFRQGDVLLITTKKRPSKQAKVVRDNGRVILAYGEVTGHAHEVIGTDTTDPVPAMELFEESDGTRLLVIKRDAELRHEEHGAIALMKDTTYEVRRQREYQPAGIVQVAD
jgi:hypothetical protein